MGAAPSSDVGIACRTRGWAAVTTERVTHVGCHFSADFGAPIFLHCILTTGHSEQEALKSSTFQVSMNCGRDEATRDGKADSATSKRVSLEVRHNRAASCTSVSETRAVRSARANDVVPWIGQRVGQSPQIRLACSLQKSAIGCISYGTTILWNGTATQFSVLIHVIMFHKFLQSARVTVCYRRRYRPPSSEAMREAR